VIRAAGAEFEADISFAALHQSLLPLLNGIEELRPRYRDVLSVALGLCEGGGPPDRLVVSGAALELARRAGQQQPLLIVLDDVLWMDRPSAEVLGSPPGTWPAATSACWPHASAASRAGAGEMRRTNSLRRPVPVLRAIS
jgi:hypothetical protein